MNDEITHRLFKKLTPQNWRQRDRTVDPFGRMNPDGSFSEVSDDEWAAEILEAKLDVTVPEDVRNLFEVAQGVFCYGCYFYPLYTLGLEQLFRVMEAAVSHKCMSLGAPKQDSKFSEKLEWLGENDHLSKQEYIRWSATRELRNIVSHAKEQSLALPTEAIGEMQLMAERINSLFRNIETK